MARPFPAAVRYTGASMAFNVAGILGASLAPYVATKLGKTYGLSAVGLYLTGAAVLTTLALWAMTRLKNEEGEARPDVCWSHSLLRTGVHFAGECS